MKIINIHNYDATGVSRSSIDLPTASEMAVASLSNLDGSTMIELWFDGNRKMFDQSLVSVRDRSSTEKLKFFRSGIVDRVAEFTEIGESPAFRTAGNVAHFFRSRPGEWTAAAVVQLGDIAENTNRSILGRTSADEVSVNMPSINVDSRGRIRIVGGLGISEPVAEYVAEIDIKTQPVLIVCSQSERNGGTIRVNADQKVQDKSPNSVRPSTGLELQLLGSDWGSAAWEGIVGSVIVQNKDISDDARSLAIIENHLMSKFGI